jgi:hypothetical protein
MSVPASTLIFECYPQELDFDSPMGAEQHISKSDLRRDFEISTEFGLLGVFRGLEHV